MSEKAKTEDVRKCLERARSLLGRGWCRGTYARDGRGNPLEFYQRGAVEWCFVGAVYKACKEMKLFETDASSKAESAVLDAAMSMGIPVSKTSRCGILFNDHVVQDKSQLLGCLDSAIEKLDAGLAVS